MKKKFLTVSVFFCIPFISWAQIWITEINYNPEGSDAGFEWVEIFNGGSAETDVTKFVLRENGTNHGIKQMGDTGEIGRASCRERV